MSALYYFRNTADTGCAGEGCAHIIQVGAKAWARNPCAVDGETIFCSRQCAEAAPAP